MADKIDIAAFKASELVEPKVDKLSPSIDLASVKKSETIYPAPAGGPLTAIQGAGVDLAKWLLAIMSTFILLALIWYWATQWGFSAHLTVNSATKDVVEAIAKDEENFQKFWTQALQTVLQNVLLPVLTAILGYTFGSAPKGKEGV